MARRHRHAETHRDANEAELVTAAEKMGVIVMRGPPLDGWIVFRGRWRGPLEIKLPEREGTAHEYTPAQKRFIRWVSLHTVPWTVWRTLGDVVTSVNQWSLDDKAR